MNTWKTVCKYVLIILGLVLLDQVTKDFLLYLITGGVPAFGPAWTIVPMPYLMAHVTDFFNIVFTWNPGTSFSLFRALGESAPIIIIVVTGFITGFVLYYLFSRARVWERVPLALIAGGAIGNLIDRVRFGAVIDFLDFQKNWLPGIDFNSITDFHIIWRPWPVFNVADIFICVGVGLYILLWWIQYRRAKTK